MQYPDRLAWAYQIKEIFCEDCYGARLLPFGANVVDGGANVGTFALFVNWLRPDARIVAVEPAPQNMEHLKRNLARIKGGNVTIVGAALGTGLGRIALEGEVSDAIRTDRNGEGSVRTAPLFELLCGTVDLLKLDVEGDEYDALESAGAGLGNVGRVVVECHEYRGRKSDLPSVITLLSQHGFSRFAINGHRCFRFDDPMLPVGCCLVHAWREDGN